MSTAIGDHRILTLWKLCAYPLRLSASPPLRLRRSDLSQLELLLTRYLTAFPRDTRVKDSARGYPTDRVDISAGLK
jgi:hypothetical protein